MSALWRWVAWVVSGLLLSHSTAWAETPAKIPGWLGVALRATEPQAPGVLISQVLRGSPAARGGLVPGDVLLRLGGEATLSPRGVIDALAAAGGGSEVALLVRRGKRSPSDPLASLRLLKVRLARDPGPEGRLRLGYVGRPAPDFEQLESASGAPPLHLRGFRGQVLLVEFWASWCVACRAIAPRVEHWFDVFGARGLRVLAITSEPVGVASGAALELGYDYPVAADPTGRTAHAYGAHALPTLFLIDRSGTVVDLLVGLDALGLARLEQSIRRSLKVPVASQHPPPATGF